MSNRTICNEDTPDPWMVAANGRFYLTMTLSNRIEIWSSSSMEDFNQCQKSVVWHPPPDHEWSADIWAPELHYLNGAWFIYTCGGRPGVGNPSHRTLVLHSNSQDPMDARAWGFVGPLQGMPDHWSIDATIFSPAPGELYCCYSGWPLGDNSDTQQNLFVIKLASPLRAIRETLVCISEPTLPWERLDNDRRGVNEGPTWVDVPGFRGIVYSANGSWTHDYKLGLLALTGDPLNKGTWQKRPTPLLTDDPSRGAPYGPGHASFIHSPYGDGTVYCVYHGTGNITDGWGNRKARVLPMTPQHFQMQAPAVACSIMAPPSMPTPQGLEAGYPGNMAQPQPPQSGPHQHGHFFDRVKNKLREL